MALVRKTWIAVLLALASFATAVPAQAQDSGEARIRKLESEVRALQRKVFPEGSGKYFAPEIAPAQSGPSTVGAPASGAVTDLLARMDAVEAQLTRLTSQAEENANRMRLLEGRLTALEAAPPAATTVSSVDSNAAAMTSGASRAASAAAAVTPSAERVAAVRAIEKPASSDPGEDDYLYGFRLWEAKFYPEAQQQLQLTLEKYPRHKRTSYTRNLLGRAYLDDGKPGTAAQHFLQNYQADKRGDRAPDSLLYLAVAMTRLKETQKACLALSEFADAYPELAAGRLSNQYASARSGVKCN